MTALRPTKAQLATEVERLRARVAELEAQDGLRESGERFRSLLQNIPTVAVQGYQLDGTTHYWNAASERLYGYTAREAIGRNLLDLIIPPDMRDGVSQAIQQMAATGQPIPAAELSLMRKDGSRVAVFSSHVIVQAADCAPELFCLDVDLTERQQVEEARRASEATLRAIFESSQQSLMLLDRERRVTALNPIARQQFAAIYGREVQLGDSIYAYIAPEALAWFENTFEQVLAGEVSHFVRPFKVGEQVHWFDYQVTPVRQADGSTNGVLLTVADITERRQAEVALRTNRDYLQAVLDAANDAVFVDEADTGQIIDVNQRMCELYGYTREEALRLPIGELSLGEPPYSQAEALAWLTKARELGPQTFEWRAKRKNGQLFWAEVSIRFAMFGPDPRFVVTVRDISKRRLAEDALRETEARFRLAFDTSPDAVNINRLTDGLYVDINQGFTALTGYTRQDVLGRTSLDLNIWHDPADRQELVRSLQATGQCDNLEAQFRRKDGSLTTALMSARVITLQGVPHILSITRDITERKRAEEQLRRYEFIANAATEFMTLINQQHVLEAANDAYCRAQDRSRRELIGRSLAEVWGEARYREKILPYVQRCFAGEIVRYEDTFAICGSEARHFQVGMYPYRAGPGSPVTYAAIVTVDVTDRVQAEAALRDLNTTLEVRVADRTRQLSEANAQLSELDQLKDDFISRISHELRTPLTSIKIYLELLEAGKPEKRQKYMQVLNEQTARLQLLIESLLEVTHQRPAPDEVTLTAVDLNHLAQALAADAGPRATYCGLSLTTQLAADLPLVKGEALLLAQALSNLMSNALSYTPAGGALNIATAQVHEGDTRWITLTIRDTGPGVSADDLSHIFDRFYRGRAAADYKTPGAGVGLFISRDIVTSLGGRLTVDSEPGAGAAFTVWLCPA